MNLHTCNVGKVSLSSIYRGDLLLFDSESSTQSLRDWCLNCFQESFGASFDITLPVELRKDEFISKATQAKKIFTNDATTKRLLEELVFVRYNKYSDCRLFYDVPRVRIIPNSSYLSSGISYNYKPHRDTWYGGSQRQVNHWISVHNVTKDSTFFIAPSYFGARLENTSDTFDLDKWDQVYRPLTSSNSSKEDRPHPLPVSEIKNSEKIGMVLQEGKEICFSGHHLHGSLENTTPKLRISIDYRVEVFSEDHKPPQNIDSKATGNYLKYMIQHPLFAN